MIPAYWIQPDAKMKEAWRRLGANASTAEELMALAHEIRAWNKLVIAFRKPGLNNNEPGGWRAVDNKPAR
jgi:hypothetical protein